MKFLKWLLCFLSVPCFLVMGLVAVVFALRYFYITLPIFAIGLWVYIATGLYNDWF